MIRRLISNQIENFESFVVILTANNRSHSEKDQVNCSSSWVVGFEKATMRALGEFLLRMDRVVKINHCHGI